MKVSFSIAARGNLLEVTGKALDGRVVDLGAFATRREAADAILAWHDAANPRLTGVHAPGVITDRYLQDQAYAVYNAALKAGTLVRAPCEVCGEVKSDGHHDDYREPLKVRWLCRKHHYQNHLKVARMAWKNAREFDKFRAEEKRRAVR